MTHSQVVIDENEHFKLVILGDENTEEAAHVLATCFSDREPMGAKQWKTQDALSFMRYVTKELGVKEQISFAVIDKNTKEIAHVLINYDYTTELNFDWSQMPSTARHSAVGAAMGSLSDKFEKDFPCVATGEVLHLYMAATKENYEGKGLFLWSSKTLVIHATERGWQKIVVEATAPSTHHVLAKKLGFTVNNTIYPARDYPELADLGQDFSCTYLVRDL